HDVPVLVCEAARHAKRVRLPCGGEGGDDHRAQVIVQLVRRYNDTWSCLLNLAAPRRIEIDQKDMPASHGPGGYHCHSDPSNLVGVSASSNRSPPSARSPLAASAHPARGFFAEVITTVAPLTSRSTSSVSPAC